MTQTINSDKIFSKKLIDPKDRFNILYNLKSISGTARANVLLLSIVGAIVIILNLLLGLHDQSVSEAQTWLYSHRSSDGDSSSPFFNALSGSGAMGAGLWFLIKAQFRKYMTFTNKLHKFSNDKNSIYKLSEIIEGRPKIELNNVKIRVVACNTEMTQFSTGSGKNRRTTTVNIPARGLLIHEEKISYLPKGEEISGYLKGEFSLEEMYKKLYHKQGNYKHGLGVHFEIQLIHDKLIDQEVIMNSSAFNYKNFLNI